MGDSNPRSPEGNGLSKPAPYRTRRTRPLIERLEKGEARIKVYFKEAKLLRTLTLLWSLSVDTLSPGCLAVMAAAL